jgi:hypothetical protein
MYQLRQADRQWLVNVGRQLSVLLKDDYDRLRYILSQIHKSYDSALSDQKSMQCSDADSEHLSI